MDMSKAAVTRARLGRAVRAACVALGGLAAMPAAAESLQDALTAAYLNNPRLEAQRAGQRATDEGVPQALSGWRPNVQANASYGKSYRDIASGPEGTDSPLSAEVSVSQPVYTGGRVQNGVDAAEARVRQGRASLAAVEQDVLLSAVTAYMNVLRDLQVVELNRNNVDVLRAQLDASRDRFEVGEATRTDVAQSQARLAGSQSSLLQAEAQLTASRAAYARIVGRMPGTLEQPPSLPMLPSSEDEALKTAFAQNPTLQAARFADEAASADVRRAKSDLNPSVSVTGSVGYGRDTVGGATESTQAQIAARLNVPLYQSGRVYSQVRQAQAVKSQRRIEIVGATRNVEEQVASAWSNLLAARATIESGQQQVRANEIALEGVRQELLVGARTTLDVLDAEQELLNSRVTLVTAVRDEYVAAFQVLSAVGLLDIETLSLPVAAYDPTTYYDRVRNKWFGFDEGMQ